MDNTILHHIPGRKVSFNDTRVKYAIVSIPKKIIEAAQISAGTHEALVTCYHSGSIYCKVKLFPTGTVTQDNMPDLHVLDSSVKNVHVTPTNVFIKISGAVIDAMGIRSGTHVIDWSCLRTLSVFGIIRPII